jgi:transposase
MEQYVGLDVSQQTTHLCVIDNDGKAVWRGQCVSTPEAIAKAIQTKAPNATRIGLESGPLSTWHWHALKAMGLPVVCLDARHAQTALSLQVNKTDKNDAEGWRRLFGWDGTGKSASKAWQATRPVPCSVPVPSSSAVNSQIKCERELAICESCRYD